MNAKALSVSELIDRIKNLLEGQFREVMVEGEVSNLSPSSAGHYYFTLSDPHSSLSVALFKMDAFRNPLIRKIKNGDKILCFGPIGVYGRKGSFQLIAKQILPRGEGELLARFESLKAKLSAEGLFLSERKKPIPEFPRRIGIITAAGGAALQDFLKVFKRRSLWMNVLIIPALVQGDMAPASLIKGIEQAKKCPGLEVLVLARGGGSLEDLWAFNDENLARQISQCPIPTISAIGHQVDFTIADFVADCRAETPTAAAELLSAGQTKIVERSEGARNRLVSRMELSFSRAQFRVKNCRTDVMLETLWKRFHALQNKVMLKNPLGKVYELTRIYEKNFLLDECLTSMTHTLERQIREKSSSLENSMNLIRALDPSGVLKRGYSFLRSEEGKIVANLESFEKMKNGEKLQVQFTDGQGWVRKSAET